METPLSPASNGRSLRVFTEADEFRLVKALYKVVAKLGSSAGTPSQITTVDPVAFERINKSLGSKFTHTQINAKLRRLKDKYRKQARTKSLIKTAHDRRIYKISRKIWGKKPITPKRNSTDEITRLIDDIQEGERGEDGMEDTQEGERGEDAVEATQEEERGEDTVEATQEEERGEDAVEATQEEERGEDAVEATQEEEEVEKRVEATQEGEEVEERVEANGGCVNEARKEKEEVDLEAFPALMSEFSRNFPENPVWRDGLSLLGEEKLREMNEKWMLLRIEEAQVMAKRAHLVSEQTKLLMEVLVSSWKRD